MKMNTKILNDIKSLLSQVSDRLKDGEESVEKCKSDLKGDFVYLGDFDYWEGYVSGLTWVKDNLSYIVNELEKDDISVENLFE